MIACSGNLTHIMECDHELNWQISKTDPTATDGFCGNDNYCYAPLIQKDDPDARSKKPECNTKYSKYPPPQGFDNSGWACKANEES